jgi:hypothetical protein
MRARCRAADSLTVVGPAHACKYVVDILRGPRAVKDAVTTAGVRVLGPGGGVCCRKIGTLHEGTMLLCDHNLGLGVP